MLRVTQNNKLSQSVSNTVTTWHSKKMKPKRRTRFCRRKMSSQLLSIANVTCLWSLLVQRITWAPLSSYTGAASSATTSPKMIISLSVSLSRLPGIRNRYLPESKQTSQPSKLRQNTRDAVMTGIRRLGSPCPTHDTLAPLNALARALESLSVVKSLYEYVGGSPLLGFPKRRALLRLDCPRLALPFCKGSWCAQEIPAVLCLALVLSFSVRVCLWLLSVGRRFGLLLFGPPPSLPTFFFPKNVFPKLTQNTTAGDREAHGQNAEPEINVWWHGCFHPYGSTSIYYNSSINIILYCLLLYNSSIDVSM